MKYEARCASAPVSMLAGTVLVCRMVESGAESAPCSDMIRYRHGVSSTRFLRRNRRRSRRLCSVLADVFARGIASGAAMLPLSWCTDFASSVVPGVLPTAHFGAR